MKILVCEDNIMTLKTLEFSLKREGHEVYKAVDGDQGIKTGQRHIGRGKCVGSGHGVFAKARRLNTVGNRIAGHTKGVLQRL